MYYQRGPFTIFWFIKSHFPELDLQPYCVLLISLWRLSVCLRKPAFLLCECASSRLREAEPVRPADGIPNTWPLGGAGPREEEDTPWPSFTYWTVEQGEARPDFHEGAGHLLILRLFFLYLCIWRSEGVIPGRWPPPSQALGGGSAFPPVLWACGHPHRGPPYL